MAKQLAADGHLNLAQVAHGQPLGLGIDIQQFSDLTDVPLQLLVLFRCHGVALDNLPLYLHFSLAKC